MSYQFITVSKNDRIAYITLNRPEKRNAFNEELVNELKSAFIKAEQDNQVKVVVLSGNGKAFSAGADLAYLQGLQQNSYDENLADSMNLKELYQLLFNYSKILIAKIKGHAIAGGAGLATVCDFSFIVPKAKIGYTEVKIGFIPAIVMVFLLQKINGNKARELLLTGKLIDAKEAVDIQLISQIVESDKIDEFVDEFANEFCVSVSGQSVANTKEMLRKVPHLTFDEAFNYAAIMNAKGRGNEDCKKGIQNFLDKQKLTW